MIDCENYNKGICEYIPKNLNKDQLRMRGKCPFTYYPIEIQNTMVAECTERKTISKLRKKDAELEQELLKIK